MITEFIFGEKPTEFSDEDILQLEKIVSNIHHVGVAYADILPQNIIRSDGRLYLVDFGEAKLREDVSASQWESLKRMDYQFIHALRNNFQAVGS